MKNIYRMYRFVKHVDECTKKREDESRKGSDRRTRSLFVKDILIEEFEKKTRYGYSESCSIADAAVENNYLIEGVSEIAKSPKIEITHIKVNPKDGRDLIDKIWFIPIGLVEACLKQYSLTIALLTGGTVVTAIYFIIKVAGHIIKSI